MIRYGLVLSAVSISMILLAGCASPRERIYPAIRSDSTEDLQKRTTLPGQYAFAFSDEWAWNKNDKNAPPKMCVALSGGGMRSANFAVGVLRGLADAKLLEHVDAISVVSGGSYAATALYAQHKHLTNSGAKAGLRAALSDRFLAHLEDNGDLFLAGQAGLAALSFIYGMPRDLFHNASFGQHRNTAPLAETYRWRLKNLFHADLHRPADERSSSDLYLSDFSPNDGLPLLIVNGTARYRFIGQKTSLSQEVFEFTPLAYGSDGLGRYRLTPQEPRVDSETNFLFRDVDFGKEPSLSLAMAVSGAAVDSTLLPTYLLQNVFSASNLGLGRHLRNPLMPDHEWRRVRFTPLPFYWFTGHYWTNAASSHFYVTDGGHSENLGAYSLIRRHCGHIIIVDGEHDASYSFDSYAELGKRLAEDPAPSKALVATLVVKKIDEIVALHENTSDRLQTAEAARNRVLANKGMFEGYIKMPDGKKLAVTYLKLSFAPLSDCSNVNRLADALDVNKIDIKPGLFESDPKAVKNKWDIRHYYYCREEIRRSQSLLGIIRTSFPQEGTADLTYSSAQVRAYRRVGEELGRLAGEAQKLP